MLSRWSIALVAAAGTSAVVDGVRVFEQHVREAVGIVVSPKVGALGAMDGVCERDLVRSEVGAMVKIMKGTGAALQSCVEPRHSNFCEVVVSDQRQTVHVM